MKKKKFDKDKFTYWVISFVATFMCLTTFYAIACLERGEFIFAKNIDFLFAFIFQLIIGVPLTYGFLNLAYYLVSNN